MKTEVKTYRTNRMLNDATQATQARRRNTAPSAAWALPLCFLALAPLFSSCTDYYDEIPTQEELARMNRGSMAQVAFSVGSAYLTRMSDATVQADNNELAKFRGIESLHLIPFYASGTNADPVTAELTKKGTELIELRSIASGTSQLYNQPNNYNTYRQMVSVPFGTNAFLCYGKAPSSDPKVEGALTENNILAQQPKDITFSLQPIVSDLNTITTTDSKGQKLVNFLNGLYTAGDWTNNVILSSLKDDFFSADNTAGSSANVLAMTLNLYDALKFAENNTAVKPVTDYIKTKVNVETGKWSDTNLDGYPGNLNLPDGAAYINWNTSTNKYEIVTDRSNSGALAIYPIENVVYPPTLYYYANSRILTHDKEIKDSELAATLERVFRTERTQWGTQSNWTGGHASVNSNVVLDQPESTGSAEYFFTGNRVNTETTIVGIAKSLQYAVSRLDITISADGATLLDANDTPITVTDGSTFPVTGILVAGQKNVDWKFEPVESATNKYTIYDSEVEGYMNQKSETTPTPFRTLVLETAKDQSVYVAIELQNNSGQDFYTGTDTDKRIVPQGCKFYLIGQLVVKDGETYVDGYNADVPSKNRVFRQDHVTTANFIVKDLKEAYNVVPDFSADQLEFSLGVLDWKMSTPASVVLE